MAEKEQQLVSIDELLERLRDEPDNKDRATVALVNAKVDGLKDLMRAEFGNVKEDIKALGTIVGDVIKLEGDSADHERRLTLLEGDRKDERDWRRINLPALVIAALAAVASIVTVVTQIH